MLELAVTPFFTSFEIRYLSQSEYIAFNKTADS